MLKRGLTFATRQPLVHTRSLYDQAAQKLAYKSDRKLAYTQSHPENITFTAAMDIFRTYTLAQDTPLSFQIELTEAAVGTAKVLRSEVTLPHPVKQEAAIRVMVLTTSDNVDAAKSLGADVVGGEELVAMLDKEYFEVNKIDKILCDSKMFPRVVRIAKLLGPLGLMPSPSKGTVGDDMAAMMGALKSSTLFESDTDKCIHIDAARSCWSDEKIEQNLLAVFRAVDKASKAKAKQTSIIGVKLSGPFTPGIQMPTRNMLDRLAVVDAESD